LTNTCKINGEMYAQVPAQRNMQRKTIKQSFNL